MTAKQIIKSLNWDSIFQNTSQTENLYYFLLGICDLKSFVSGFYPRSRNKSLIKNNLTIGKIPHFKFHAKKIYILERVHEFRNGDEQRKIQEYVKNL